MARRYVSPIRLDTREYELTHGKKPRGEGYWAFSFPYAPEHLRKETVFLNGTLTHCKQIIRRDYPYVSTVKVLP